MAQILFAKRRVTVKVAVWGSPGAGRKATLEALARTDPREGAVRPVELDEEAAWRLELTPEWTAPVRDLTVVVQLFATRGPLEARRPSGLVLGGADAVLWVVDSRPAEVEAGEAALRLLQDELAALEADPADLPQIAVWNQRDRPDALPVADLEARFGDRVDASHAAVATTGEGVLEALQSAVEPVLADLRAV